MGWATHYIQKLQEGETIKCRPKGNSMQGKVESGQLCTVEPIGDHEIQPGDILLCKVKGRQFLHLCTAVQGKRVQISNNKGHVNGWIGRKSIYGRLTKVED